MTSESNIIEAEINSWASPTNGKLVPTWCLQNMKQHHITWAKIGVLCWLALAPDFWNKLLQMCNFLQLYQSHSKAIRCINPFEVTVHGLLSSRSEYWNKVMLHWTGRGNTHDCTAGWTNYNGLYCISICCIIIKYFSHHVIKYDPCEK